jgi:hypothetical protein
MKNYLRQLALIALVCALFAALPASAELTVEQVQKLLADDGAARDNFGSRLSLDGDTAVIGARGDGQNGVFSGSAYVFTRTDGEWTQQAKLLADDGAARDFFGESVSLDGDTVVIGATGDDQNGVFSGSAYVFTRTDGQWTQQAKLLADDGAASDSFGTTASLDGDTVVIGAPGGRDGRGIDSGAAYVFTRTNGVWSQQAKLFLGDGLPGEAFGEPSISLDGDTVVIAADFDRSDEPGPGSANVFTRVDGVWSAQARLVSSDGFPWDNFGIAISLDGDTVAIGMSNDDDNGEKSGSAYVFARAANVWTQQAKLLPDDGAARDFFGYSVSIDGDTAVIGAQGNDDKGEGSGSAYVFARADNKWTQQAKLLADDGTAGDYFGRPVSLDGDTAVIGATGHFQNPGSAYVFHILSDPIDMLNALAGNVRSLDLHHGTENSLLAKLDAALALLTDLVDGNDHAAQNVLEAFVNQVEAQHGKKIPSEDADGLIEDAQEIIELLVEE